MGDCDTKKDGVRKQVRNKKKHHRKNMRPLLICYCDNLDLIVLIVIIFVFLIFKIQK